MGGNILTRIKVWLKGLRYDIETLGKIAVEDFIDRQMRENPRYQNSKRLNMYEQQVYSQNGEDGIIAEIFRRIGTKNKFFVEFGVGDGLENNTAYLLLKNWTGYWIDGNKESVNRIKQRFSLAINKKILLIDYAFVTAESIEALFKKVNVPEEFDLLSIDINGNDYWVWKAIENYRPRVVIIEYNAIFPPDVELVIKYNPKFVGNETCYFGASLKSLEILGSKKGYKLVGCDFRGVNAFFVREDLVKDKFLEPFTAENHYEPYRSHYLGTKIDHPRPFAFGDFEK